MEPSSKRRSFAKGPLSTTFAFEYEGQSPQYLMRRLESMRHSFHIDVVNFSSHPGSSRIPRTLASSHSVAPQNPQPA